MKLIVIFLIGIFLGTMITAYLYFPDCWKTILGCPNGLEAPEDTCVSDGAASRIYAHGFSDAELKFKQPLYNGSNSYLLEKDEPYKSYKLKNLSSDLFAKRTINGTDQLLIDELLCSANSCDKLNNGAVCLQCDYSVVTDREQKQKDCRSAGDGCNTCCDSDLGTICTLMYCVQSQEIEK